MPALTCDLFCRVIDNHGDIGVCWRLARQLVEAYGFRLRLWLDDLASLPPLCPDYVAGQLPQPHQLASLTVHPWAAAETVTEAADLVIEAFACELPATYLQAMLARQEAGCPSVWLNLEYLSAEDWVADCHNLTSTHPQTGLVKRFFFPGFTPATGGLLREQTLLTARDAFCADSVAQARFWQQLGLASTMLDQCQISLFCYETAPVEALLSALQTAPHPVRCLVTAGKATQAVQRWLQAQGLPPEGQRIGPLELAFLPFLPQQDYDRLLWCCDLNFVRGEDSFVRAQWAGKPFVWQIYKQDDDAHLVKLAAFLARYPATPVMHACWQHWNHAAPAPDLALSPWHALLSELPAQTQKHQQWLEILLVQPSLAQQIVKCLPQAENSQ